MPTHRIWSREDELTGERLWSAQRGASPAAEGLLSESDAVRMANQLWQTDPHRPLSKAEQAIIDKINAAGPSGLTARDLNLGSQGHHYRRMERLVAGQWIVERSRPAENNRGNVRCWAAPPAQPSALHSLLS